MDITEDIPQWIKESEKLLQNLNRIPHDQSAIVVVRHSHRTEITKVSEAIGALLTDIGKQKAKEFGEKATKGKNYRLYSSSIERCIQTAENIKQGIEKHTTINSSIRQLEVLTGMAGDGFHIATELMKDHRSFILRWACNHFTPAIIEPISTYAARAANFMFSHHLIRDKPTIDIFVTHDLNLMGLQLAWTGKFQPGEWVEYLSGFILILKEKSWVVIRGDDTWEIPFPYWWPIKELVTHERILP